ncbi:MAG: hypothetical protein UX62_C0007G0012 [Microgenomates group bacterium GW2011_GWA2_46_7]|nr:MAG: hypothetical protein UX64_C0017G0006 [Microgenomates group bacterium GW2011_GWC2_46_7]KKU46815.1 MAG: hypothetical protein UX62_C0007G0012 [Microgenomates group bacterium GW2011_GWA2_46_7]
MALMNEKSEIEESESETIERHQEKRLRLWERITERLNNSNSQALKKAIGGFLNATAIASPKLLVEAVAGQTFPDRRKLKPLGRIMNVIIAGLDLSGKVDIVTGNALVGSGLYIGSWVAWGFMYGRDTIPYAFRNARELLEKKNNPLARPLQIMEKVAEKVFHDSDNYFFEKEKT